MKSFLIGCGIFLVVLIVGGLILGSFFVGKYNTMITAQKDIENQQAQVEVQLQRRFDLIPNLVESVKGIMDQEEDIFVQIAEARTKYGSAEAGSPEKIEAANELEGTLSRLLVIMENYPELKSNQSVTALMDELAGTENRIAVERRRYNELVTTYNKMIVTFPDNLIAQMFGFTEKPLFEAVEGAEETPTVDLTD